MKAFFVSAPPLFVALAPLWRTFRLVSVQRAYIFLSRIFPSLLVVVVVIVVVVDRREMFVWVPVVSSGCSRRGRPFKCLPWFGFNEEC